MRSHPVFTLSSRRLPPRGVTSAVRSPRRLYGTGLAMVGAAPIGSMRCCGRGGASARRQSSSSFHQHGRQAACFVQPEKRRARPYRRSSDKSDGAHLLPRRGCPGLHIPRRGRAGTPRQHATQHVSEACHCTRIARVPFQSRLTNVTGIDLPIILRERAARRSDRTGSTTRERRLHGGQRRLRRCRSHT
jgi:hypothetical protein